MYKSPSMSAIIITQVIGSHIGDNTHSQDQSMYSVSFNPMNKTVSKPKNPIPPLELLLI